MTISGTGQLRPHHETIVDWIRAGVSDEEGLKRLSTFLTTTAFQQNHDCIIAEWKQLIIILRNKKWIITTEDEERVVRSLEEQKKAAVSNNPQTWFEQFNEV